MSKEDIFIDKKNNDIFSKYKNTKIKKMYLIISYIDKNLLKILEYICEERNINKLVKHHTSLILVMEREGENILLKIDKLLSGVVLREVNSLNNIIYFKSVKLSKRKILFSQFLDNYIKEKSINSLHSYDPLDDNCFTFINDIIKLNNLSIPKNNLIQNLYKSYLNIKLDENKRRFGLSIKTITRIINFIFTYKIMRIILMLIAQFVS
tara:strand:- start:24462 stop:25085 length:624 start_codon:yes stop_codon:yes gene_type:complete